MVVEIPDSIKILLDSGMKLLWARIAGEGIRRGDQVQIRETLNLLYRR